MNEELDTLTQPYLQKSIQDCSVQELQQLTHSFPFFAPAHLALLKKLKQENEAEYNRQLGKTVLYYYDPLQFETFINSEKFSTNFDVEKKAALAPVEIPSENGTNHQQTEPAAAAPVSLQLEPGEQIIIRPDAPPQLNNTESTAHPLPFEPLYTVDYFASQGIKLSQEETQVPTDRIGKQLKSFTEWIKTMKRLPAPQLSQNLNTSTDDKVQNLAEHSLEEAEVVTETMAEVWLKQGNKEKAIKVYNKLSLHNPSKKAYFAAKIEHLKAS